MRDVDWYSSKLNDLNRSWTSLVCFHNPLRKITLNVACVLLEPNCTFCICCLIEYSENIKYVSFTLRAMCHERSVCLSYVVSQAVCQGFFTGLERPSLFVSDA